MTPAVLAKLLSIFRKDDDHGSHTCPKCSLGFMAYQKAGPSNLHACTKCGWIEFGNPPWKKVGA